LTGTPLDFTEGCGVGVIFGKDGEAGGEGEFPGKFEAMPARQEVHCAEGSGERVNGAGGTDANAPERGCAEPFGEAGEAGPGGAIQGGPFGARHDVAGGVHLCSGDFCAADIDCSNHFPILRQALAYWGFVGFLVFSNNLPTLGHPS